MSKKRSPWRSWRGAGDVLWFRCRCPLFCSLSCLVRDWVYLGPWLLRS